YRTISSVITASAGEAVPIAVVRDGERVDLEVTPLLTPRPVVDADGEYVRDADGDVVYRDVGFIGIEYAIRNVPQPVTAVPAYVGDSAARIGYAIVTLPARVADLAQSTF